MKILAIAASVLITLAAMSFAPAQAQNDLTFDATSGPAPLTVTVSGPKRLNELIAACKYGVGWITPGFSIDWGDGQVDPQYSDQAKQGQSCGHVKTHVYTVPGTYKVKARVYHLGPTDAPETDWAAFTTIRVNGQGTQAEPVLKITNINEGERFGFQGIPSVDWTLNTAQQVDIITELLASDGIVLDSKVKKGVAYSGPGRSLIIQTNKDYNEALRRKAVPFTLRISALKDGKVVASDERHVQVSGEFKSPTGGLQFEPATGKAPLTIKFTYPYYHKDCFSYRLDWGDGTRPDEHEVPVRRSCVLGDNVLTLIHTYTKPGTYDAVLHSTNIEAFRKLDDLVMFETGRVTVTP